MTKLKADKTAVIPGFRYCVFPLSLGGVNAEAAKIVEQLGLTPLPQEGGFFRQTWLSLERVDEGRNAGSAIYFLMTEADFSALHRLTTDEIWHFYAGDAVLHLQLNPKNGEARVSQLGPNLIAGQTPQLIVSGGMWQGARLAGTDGAKHGWALLGCTMSPAWDERGFQLGGREELMKLSPASAPLIASLTR